jgi:transposase
MIENVVYTIAWARNKTTIAQEKRVDGIFPLLSTDECMSAKDALKAYKYQPRLEKRFTQFKDIHNGAPLLVKKLERVEAVMFIFFLAMIVQAVIEREIRMQMQKQEIQWLPIYPEGRIAYHPTTAKVFDRFEGVSIYHRKRGGKVIQEYRDTLNDLQKQIIEMLAISESEYWLDTKL